MIFFSFAFFSFKLIFFFRSIFITKTIMMMMEFPKCITNTQTTNTQTVLDHEVPHSTIKTAVQFFVRPEKEVETKNNRSGNLFLFLHDVTSRKKTVFNDGLLSKILSSSHNTRKRAVFPMFISVWSLFFCSIHLLYVFRYVLALEFPSNYTL